MPLFLNVVFEQEQKEKDERQPRKALKRRFIVTEGVFETEGDLSPLPSIVSLANEFKYRLILDDSFGFCTLGRTGRGSPEHWGLQVNDIDMYVAAMDHAMATQGKFLFEVCFIA